MAADRPLKLPSSAHMNLLGNERFVDYRTITSYCATLRGLTQGTSAVTLGLHTLESCSIDSREKGQHVIGD